MIRKMKNYFRVFVGPRKNGFLIYTMGKVGSSTLSKQFKGSYHFHTLESRSVKRYGTAGIVSSILKFFMHRILQVIRVKRVRKFIQRSDQLWILSGFRNPVRRNISAYFQHLNRRSRNLDKPAYLVREFFSCYPQGTHIEWFDIELKEYLGINIYDYPFDYKKGYIVIREGKINLLLYRTENLDSVIEYLSSITNSLGKTIDNYNVYTDKWYSDIYMKFSEKIDFSHEYINYIYDNDVTRYFYTEDQINDMKKEYVGERKS